MEQTSNYKKYKSKNILKRIMIRLFKKKISSLLSEYSSNTTLLDVGCGEGFIADYIYKNTNIKKITGIDINNNSIQIARNQNNNIVYETLDINDITLENKKYDLVMCLEVLEHLKNPEHVLKKICSLANKRIIISIPNEPFFSIGNLLSFKNIRSFGTPKEHINIWTRRSFKKCLLNIGIKKFRIKSLFVWIIVIIDV